MTVSGDSSPFPVSATSVEVAPQLSALQDRPITGAPVDGASQLQTLPPAREEPLRSGLRRASDMQARGFAFLTNN